MEFEINGERAKKISEIWIAFSHVYKECLVDFLIYPYWQTMKISHDEKEKQ